MTDAETLALLVCIPSAMVVASHLRGRTAVALVSVVASAGTIPIALLAALAATPCGIDGQGVLEPTPDCRVQAVHITSAIFGGGGCLAMLVASVAGLAYAASGGLRARRVFRIFLFLAGLVLALGIVITAVLPSPLVGGE